MCSTVHLNSTQEGKKLADKTMSLAFVTGSDNILEGIGPDGKLIKAYGTLALNEGVSYQGTFEGKIQEPAGLFGQPCSAVIDDTEAILTISKKISPHYAELIMMA